MKFLIIILLFVFCFSLGKTQKTIPFSQQKKKVPIKDINFRNYQFTWADSLKNDSITFSWFTYTDKFKTLFPGCELFNPGENLSKSDFYIPNATRFNQHVIQNFEFDSDSLLFRVTEVDEKNLSKQFMPFYFKNIEVTNGEYKEFVRYVRDSIARKLLANYHPEKYLKIPKDFKGDDYSSLPLNWEVEFNYNDPELMPILAPMYFPDHEKFYWHRMFDNKKLVYKYFEIDPYYYSDIPGLENNSSNAIPHSLPIYPDTSCWVEDSRSAFADPLMRNYFWHEAYDDHPVVGINFAQAQAFCIWKTEQINKKLTNKKLPFEFEVALPKEFEWEYVLNRQIKTDAFDRKNGYYITSPFSSLNLDLDWKTNLIFSWGDKFDIYDKSFLDTVKTDNRFIFSDNELSGYYKIVNSASFTVKSEILKNYVSYWSMSDNVSEWMDEDFYNYQLQWNYRAGALLSDTTSLNFNTYKDEINNYSLNSSSIKISRDGKLVRGSNWFDKGSPEYQNFSMQKAQRKAFINKNNAHSTVGFRYVIRLKPKY